MSLESTASQPSKEVNKTSSSSSEKKPYTVRNAAHDIFDSAKLGVAAARLVTSGLIFQRGGKRNGQGGNGEDAARQRLEDHINRLRKGKKAAADRGKEAKKLQDELDRRSVWKRILKFKKKGKHEGGAKQRRKRGK